MKKLFGILATLILAFSISASTYANTGLAKPSLKTKSSITKMNTKKSAKPKKHHRHHRHHWKAKKAMHHKSSKATKTMKTTGH